MLAQAALDVMSEVVSVIFGRLHSLPESPATPPATLAADPSLHLSAGQHLLWFCFHTSHKTNS